MNLGKVVKVRQEEPSIPMPIFTPPKKIPMPIILAPKKAPVEVVRW